MKKVFYLFFTLLILLLLAGCVSIVESAGRALDGSAFTGKKTAVYRHKQKNGTALNIEICTLQNKAGERSISIALDKYPSMLLRCSFPNDEGFIYFTSLEYLGGGVSGWNEYTLELSGTGKLVLGANEAVLSVPFAPEPVRISAGRLRRYDTRITGNEALALLNNRRERILALVEWMQGRENVPPLQDQKAFENYWKPLALPEMASRKKRPALWRQAGDIFVRAEDIRWNTSYSERVFPENLRAVRNSGTLLRDWEEALNWIYLEYHWEFIFASFAGGAASSGITVPLKK